MTRAIVFLLCAAFFIGAGMVPPRERTAWAAGSNRLVEAARDGHVDEVRALIGEGVEVDHQANPNATTALMIAANQGYLEVVELLLAAGADPSRTLAGEWTALDFAVQNGQLPVVERLLRAEPAPTTEQMNRALLTAARTGHPKTAGALIASGADVNGVGEDGMTPLTLAAKWGYPSTTQELLAQGGDPARPDQDGRTPLMWAAWQGHGVIVENLLAVGADPARRDRFGDSAFMGRTDMTEIAALMERHSARIEVRPEACSALIGFGLLARGPDGAPRVGGYGISRAPEVGSSGWVIPHSQTAPRALRVVGTEPSEHPENSWNVTFETPPSGTLDIPAGRSQENVTLLWTPPKASNPTRVTAGRAQLPWGVFPETVQSAIDLDDDGAPDILDLGFCCGDPTTSRLCEYRCGENWQRDRGRWLKCEASTPA